MPKNSSSVSSIETTRNFEFNISKNSILGSDLSDHNSGIKAFNNRLTRLESDLRWNSRRRPLKHSRHCDDIGIGRFVKQGKFYEIEILGNLWEDYSLQSSVHRWIQITGQISIIWKSTSIASTKSSRDIEYITTIVYMYDYFPSISFVPNWPLLSFQLLEYLPSDYRNHTLFEPEYDKYLPQD